MTRVAEEAWTEAIKGLNEIAEDCHQISRDHGFWDHETLPVSGSPDELVRIDNPSIWSEKIALMHSEASEMLEKMRNEDEEGLGEECADLLIRLLDFTANRQINLEQAVVRKMLKNQGRPYKHGRKF